jgi:dephospho-CoA kinase
MTTRHTHTVVIGIAGGSGTGKSTVAAHLAQKYGGVHVDGDRVAHAVLNDDAEVKRRIRGEFGDDVFDAGDRIDRRKLGRVVFQDADALQKLNAIVHPAVVAQCARAVERARNAGTPLIVIDAALLLEVPLPFALDLMVALRADRDERERRLLAKGGHGDAEIRDRLDAQDGMEKHFYKADAVVDTGQELASVLAEMEVLVEVALQRAHRS